MRNRFALLALTAAVAVSAAACSGPPTGGGTPGQTSTAAASTVPTLPPRPREIDLTGVDVCSLLTPEQQQELGIDRPPTAGVDTDGHRNTYCDYRHSLSSPRFGYQVTIVGQEDASLYLTGERNVVSRVVSAAGFPAVQARRPTDERGCFVLVSTKDGQYFDVQYGESTGSNDTPEVACEKARVTAEMAMQTLLTQR
ncbi:MAG: DUF3558 domain-containing protein [Pseudonocardiaceae bacterium]